MSNTSRRTLLAGVVAAPFIARGAMAQPAAAPPAPPQPPTGPQTAPPAAPLSPPYPVVGKIERLDPALDALIDVNAPVEKVLDGFVWSEGPVWVGGADGMLLASDVRANQIFSWSPRTGGAVWMKPSGYREADGRDWSPTLREPGTNGLILARGGIVACDCGTRAIVRYDIQTKARTILADRFEGKRFNSPNDAVLHPDGSIYFTDPPYGLFGTTESPLREMDYTGIFRLAPDNSVTLVDRTTFPNGIGLTPDGTKLIATDRTGWIMWDLDGRGQASNKRLFIGRDTGILGGDGFKIDTAGNMWASGRDGISIFTPQGKRIGVISADQVISNCELGADGYLYMSSNVRIIRVKVKPAARKLLRANI
jgi:gluconolactonase